MVEWRERMNSLMFASELIWKYEGRMCASSGVVVACNHSPLLCPRRLGKDDQVARFVYTKKKSCLGLLVWLEIGILLA